MLDKNVDPASTWATALGSGRKSAGVGWFQPASAGAIDPLADEMTCIVSSGLWTYLYPVT